MGIKHVVVAGLREKNADSTNASFNGRAFLSCSPPWGEKARPIVPKLACLVSRGR